MKKLKLNGDSEVIKRLLTYVQSGHKNDIWFNQNFKDECIFLLEHTIENFTISDLTPDWEIKLGEDGTFYLHLHFELYEVEHHDE